MDGEHRIRARIRDAIQLSGGVGFMNKATGIPEGTLKKYVAMTSMASFENASKIARAAGIPLDGLASDDMPERTAHEGQETGSDSHSTAVDLQFVTLPIYPERASAGTGVVKVDEIQTSGFMSFEERWLRALGVNPGTAFLLVATGDSMYPTIPDGAAMICDASHRDIQNGFVYAFSVDGDLIVKRVERLLDGTIDLISDNKDKYPTRNYKASDVMNLDVLGRIFYVGRPL